MSSSQGGAAAEKRRNPRMRELGFETGYQGWAPKLLDIEAIRHFNGLPQKVAL